MRDAAGLPRKGCLEGKNLEREFTFFATNRIRSENVFGDRADGRQDKPALSRAEYIEVRRRCGIHRRRKKR